MDSLPEEDPVNSPKVPSFAAVQSTKEMGVASGAVANPASASPAVGSSAVSDRDGIRVPTYNRSEETLEQEAVETEEV